MINIKKFLLLTLLSIYSPTIAQNIIITSFQKISDTQGNFTGILDDTDKFGSYPCSLGDLDGDGIIDIAVGAQNDDDGGSGRGAVWILFLNSDGTVKSHQKISDTQGGFTGTLQNWDSFGTGIENLGDLDNDGVIDLAVGAFQDHDGPHGAVWILFMNSNGTVKSHQKINGFNGGFTGQLDTGDWFAFPNSLGDLDGDGVIDIAVSAGKDDDGGTDRGAIWILFMNSNGTVKSHQKISDTQGGFTGILADNDLFGSRTETIGDLDGDGVVDIVASGALNDDGGPNRGAIWILYLNSNGTVKSHQKISDLEGNFTGVLLDNDNFGHGFRNLGDIDNDGVVDLLVGASGDDTAGTTVGAFWFLYLNADGTVKSHQKMLPDTPEFPATMSPWDSIGAAMSGMVDVNQDGFLDFVLGSSGDDDGGDARGAVWVLFMDYPQPDLPVQVKSFQKISDTQGGFSGILTDGDTLKSPIPIGDLDGDGNNDIIAGADGDDDGGSTRGALWVMFLNSDGTVKSHQKISDTQGGFTGTLVNGNRFGIGLENIGDLDGDGNNDVAAGARFGDGGNVWILFLNSNGTVKSHQKITEGVGGFTGDLDIGDQFGIHIANLGDFNNDGINDLIVTARGDDDGVQDAGAIWLLYMNTNGTVKSHQKISATQGNFTGTLDTVDQFGNGASPIGDIDGDGIIDIAVGAWNDDDGGTDKGAVWILFMNSNGTVKSHQKISDTTGGLTYPMYDGSNFGSSVKSTGDLDFDGIPEITVGVRRHVENNKQTGAVYLLFLNSDGTVKSQQIFSAENSGFAGMLDIGDSFGANHNVSSDIDKDGRLDLLIASAGDDDGGNNRGATWILYLDYITDIHVDTNLGDDFNGGGSREDAYETIQKGIDEAINGQTVLVWPGVYNENIDLSGKAITLKSAADAAILESPSFATISCTNSEEPNTIIENFIIHNSQIGMLIDSASPTTRFLTITNNTIGISASGTSNLNIENSIFWDNTNDMVNGVSVTEQANYCNFTQAGFLGLGTGNLNVDPLFADTSNGDYHIVSQTGRFYPLDITSFPGGAWFLDGTTTSPCLDAGDPSITPTNERMPNGGRINIGAHANTQFASMSPWPFNADLNFDGRVNMVDFSIFSSQWLMAIFP